MNTEYIQMLKRIHLKKINMKLIKKITNDLQKLQELIDEQKQIDEQFTEAVRKFDKEKK